MCGIVGFANLERNMNFENRNRFRFVLADMIDSIKKRGPDEYRYFYSPRLLFRAQTFNCC